VKLKTIMQDRPDLIVSELSGLAFDSLQCVFRPRDLEIMFAQKAPDPELNGDVWIFIDPAAGGPQSDYALLSFTRHKGLVTVRSQHAKYNRQAFSSSSSSVSVSLLSHGMITSTPRA
jgi:hypothetical protein